MYSITCWVDSQEQRKQMFHNCTMYSIVIKVTVEVKSFLIIHLDVYYFNNLIYINLHVYMNIIMKYAI